MKTRLIRIGNSQGVRLPKIFIIQSGLGREVEMHVKDKSIVIEPVSAPRAGWSEAAREMNKRQEDMLLDSPIPTQFDEEEWQW